MCEKKNCPLRSTCSLSGHQAECKCKRGFLYSDNKCARVARKFKVQWAFSFLFLSSIFIYSFIFNVIKTNHWSLEYTTSFQCGLKMKRTFTPSLSDSTSKDFKSLAEKIAALLLRLIRKYFPHMKAIRVIRFRRGSVIADYEMIVTNSSAAEVNLPLTSFTQSRYEAKLFHPFIDITNRFLPTL